MTTSMQIGPINLCLVIEPYSPIDDSWTIVVEYPQTLSSLLLVGGVQLYERTRIAVSFDMNPSSNSSCCITNNNNKQQ